MFCYISSVHKVKNLCQDDITVLIFKVEEKSLIKRMMLLKILFKSRQNISLFLNKTDSLVIKNIQQIKVSHIVRSLKGEGLESMAAFIGSLVKARP